MSLLGLDILGARCRSTGGNRGVGIEVPCCRNEYGVTRFNGVTRFSMVSPDFEMSMVSPDFVPDFVSARSTSRPWHTLVSCWSEVLLGERRPTFLLLALMARLWCQAG